MGAYIINVPSTVDRIIYVHVDANTGKTAVVSQQMEDLTPYTEPDLEQVRKEAYEKGYKAGKEHCPGQLSCMDVVYQKGFRDGTKQCVNCEDFKENAKKEAYQRGLADAWECARKLMLDTNHGGLTNYEIEEIFGVDEEQTIINYSASEAIEKIRQYEQKQEIKVGDEVSLKSGAKGFVTRMVMFGDEQISAYVVWSDGYVGSYNLDGLQKTGKHYSEIAEVLAKMKEGE